MISSSKLVYSQKCSDRHLIEIDQTVIKYIKENFPSSRIADTSDFINYWCAFYEGKEVPYYAMSDFNGDGFNDYALMLFSNKKLDMIIINGNSSGHFTLFNLMSDSSLGLDNMISKPTLEIGFGISPPGEIYDFETDSTYNVETNSLIVYFFEKAAESYYWKDNVYIKLHSGD